MSSLPEWAKDVAQFLAFLTPGRSFLAFRSGTEEDDCGRRGMETHCPGESGKSVPPSRMSSQFNVASTYVPRIARTGRHYNCSFILATQLARDFFSDNSIGRPMIESCSTKIVLKQDEAASDLLTEQLSMSHDEGRFIQKCTQGQGLLLTPEGRVQFYNLLSDDEKKSFTTKPKEMKI